MKVLILTNLDLGLYKFRKELIQELINQNNEIVISLPNGDLVRSFEEMGCQFIDTPIDRRGINPITDMKLFFFYRKIIRTVDPDLIITYTIKPNIYGGIAASIEKIHYAVNITGLGTAFEKPGLVKMIVICLYKVALKKAMPVFFENRKNRELLVSFGCCKAERTVVLNGAGVNTDNYEYIPFPSNSTVRFLFIGRVMKEKGIDELLEATKLLIESGVNCFLDVVGPLEENYEDTLKQYESEGWLKYHGYQEDVKPFIAVCDCFILPSYHEGMANTNLECASSGRPVITSNIPGCRESIIENTSGYLCEVKNANSLYYAMKKMVEIGKEGRAQMGIEGRKHMIEMFDKSKVVQETIQSLEAFGEELK